MSGEEIRQNKDNQQPLDEGVQSLAEMPSFEQHISSMETETNTETAEQLRERFTNDQYDSILDESCSYHSAIERHLSGQSHIENEDLEKIMRRRLLGEWNPHAIAEKYGDSVERYGVSLADINVLVGEAEAAIFYNWDHNSMGTIESGYECFCAAIPQIIEEHFSNRETEDYKKNMASIVRKLSNGYKHRYENNVDLVLTDEEKNFLVSIYSEAAQSGFEYIPPEYRYYLSADNQGMVNMKKNPFLVSILDAIDFLSPSTARDLETATRKNAKK